MRCFGTLHSRPHSHRNTTRLTRVHGSYWPLAATATLAHSSPAGGGRNTKRGAMVTKAVEDGW